MANSKKPRIKHAVYRARKDQVSANEKTEEVPPELRATDKGFYKPKTWDLDTALTDVRAAL